MEGSFERKRTWSKGEMIEMVKNCENFQEAAEKICD
jgi:hypothetical protein